VVFAQQPRPPDGTGLDQPGRLKPVDLSMKGRQWDVDLLRELGHAVVLLWV